jgi:hypothetical protein
VLDTIGKRVLVKEFARTVKAIETRNYGPSPVDSRTPRTAALRALVTARPADGRITPLLGRPAHSMTGGDDPPRGGPDDRQVATRVLTGADASATRPSA